MKTRRLLFLFAVLLIFGAVACSDDDVAGPLSSESSGSVSSDTNSLDSASSMTNSLSASSTTNTNGSFSSSPDTNSSADSSGTSASSTNGSGGSVSSVASSMSSAASSSASSESSSSSAYSYTYTYTETFENLSISSYTTGSLTLDSGFVWSGVDVYPEGSTTAYAGAKALRLNDDTAGASLTSPAMNGLGSVSFYYRTLNSEPMPSTLAVQVSVSGGSWTTVSNASFQTQSYLPITAWVNSTASDIRFRILSDNQAGHLIVDQIVWTTDGVSSGSSSSSSISSASSVSSQSSVSSAASSSASSESSSSSSAASSSSSSAAPAPVWISAFTGEATTTPQAVVDGGKGWINLTVGDASGLSALGSWKVRAGNYQYINDLLSSADIPAGWFLQDGDVIRIHESGYSGTTDSSKSDNNSQFWDITTASTYYADSAYGAVWLEDGNGNIINIVAYDTDNNTSNYWLVSTSSNPLERLQSAVSSGLWPGETRADGFLLSPYASNLARLKNPAAAGSSAADWETATLLVDDNDNPSVSISNPADGSSLTSYNLTFAGTASDATSGVAAVQVKLDTGAWVSASGSSWWTNTFANVTEGSHTLTVRAVDQAGNYSSEQSVTVTVTHPADNDNPTVSISSPANGATVADLTPTISGSAADPGATASGVSYVQIRFNGGSWITATGTGSWSYTPSSDLTAGSHTVEAQSVDNKGNASAVSQISVTLTQPSGLTRDGSLPQTVQDYYNSAYGTTGNALRSALKTIISANFSSQSYTPGVWNAYYTTDVAPNGKVWDMYSSTSEDGSTAAYWFTLGTDQDRGSGSAEGDVYNREHSWPKSWFGDASPMYTDLYHVVPSDKIVNGKRSNYAFGETDSPTWISLNGSKLGPARSGLGYSGTVFEPIDIYKGDFARIYFYMSTRYWGVSENGPMTSGNFRLSPWVETMLKQWHQTDPVSQKEIDRNNAVEAIQGNRNPFVDYPDAVDLIDFTQ